MEKIQNIGKKPERFMNNLDEADFAYKQTVDLGNYELDTWKNWAEVLNKIGDYNSVIQVLIQGLDFYPDNSDLTYKLAGIHLKNNDLDEAKTILSKAMKLDIGKLPQFEKEFPEFIEVDWVKALVLKIRKTAK